MTRTSTVLGDDCSGALRASELNVATIMAAIKTFETSIFNLKKKCQNCKADLKISTRKLLERFLSVCNCYSTNNTRLNKYEDGCSFCLTT